MKKILIALSLLSSLAIAETPPGVQPSPVDNPRGTPETGAIVAPTPEQKASVKPPVKAKKKKKSKKASK